MARRLTASKKKNIQQIVRIPLGVTVLVMGEAGGSVTVKAHENGLDVVRRRVEDLNDPRATFYTLEHSA